MKRLVGILFCVVFLQLVSAVPTIVSSSGTSYSVGEGEVFLFNFSVTNDPAYFENITMVNVTIPAGFDLIIGSGGTSSSGTFSASGNDLIWASSSFLVNGSNTEYFWGEINSSTVSPGSYDLEVFFSNSSDTLSQNISVTVTDSACIPDWSCTNLSSCVRGNMTRTCEDLNDCGDNSTMPALMWACSSVCVPSWNCTAWSDCIDKLQIRSCVDENFCGNDSNKPLENQVCVMSSACVPEWDCTSWPEDCVEGQLIMRNCVDLNSCGDIEAMPSNSKICEIQKDFTWLFYSVVGLVVIMIFLMGSLLFIEVRKGRAMSRKPL
jgi:hypothetical protein